VPLEIFFSGYLMYKIGCLIPQTQMGSFTIVRSYRFVY